MAGFDEIALSLKEQVEKIGFQDVQDDIKRIHQTTVTRSSPRPARRHRTVCWRSAKVNPNVADY